MAIDIISSKVPKYTEVPKQPVKTEVHIDAPHLSNAAVTAKVQDVQADSGSNSDAGAKQQAMEGQVSEEFIKATVKDTNTKLRTSNTRCEFKYHEDTKRISITIRDQETDEVIKEIPPEKSLEMVARMWELAGILVDEKR